MQKTIDCLFIGHNETGLVEYEKTVRKMGIQSGAYRDLNLNFIYYGHKPYSASEIYNLLSRGDSGTTDPRGRQRPLSNGDTFSAAIAHLGTYLHRRNLSFDYINYFSQQQEELKEKLLQENILTIAIITTLYVSVFPILEIMDFIKRYNHSARIIIGGPFISTQYRTQTPDALEYLFASTIGADFYVISSQGEATLVNIIHALKNDLPLHEIKNLYYKSEKGYVFTGILKEDNPLSENMVDWNLFSQHLWTGAAIRTAISCPFSCSFCGFPEHAGKYQYVDVDTVYRHLLILDNIGEVNSINFIDDTFNVPVKRFKEILRMMIRNRFKFKWTSNFRCQFADREMVELMKESGCDGVFLGIESANNNVLENMNKNADLDKYKGGIALLKEYGIMTMGSFILGFPGETPDTVNDTIAFIRQTQLDFFRVQLWYCEPITPIWKKREEFGLRGESFEWAHNTMNSKQAGDFIDKIFLTIDKSVWVPQYNFDFDKIRQMKRRGMDLTHIKEFLEAFREGVKEKLTDPTRQEVSFEVIMKLKKSLTGNNGPGDRDYENEGINTIDRDNVQFNFY